MELDFAFLADAAEVTGGKLYVMGGAIDTFWVQSLPVTLPRITLALRLLLSPAETGRQHNLEIILLDEDGKKLNNLNGNFNVERSAGLAPGMRQPFCVALNFFNLRFDKMGGCSIEILVNGTSLKSVPLRVVQATTAATH